MSSVARYRAGVRDVVTEAGTQAALALDPDWESEAWTAIHDLARSGLEFAADDLLWIVGPPRSAGSTGALFRRAARSGLIRPVGVTRSTRLSRHGGLQRIWKGV